MCAQDLLTIARAGHGRDKNETISGKTIAVATLTARDVRPLRGQEILHVRELIEAA